MSDDAEWTDWIEHDGKGFPVAIGTLVHRKFDEKIDLYEGEPCTPTDEIIERLSESELDAWLWVLPRWHPIGEVARVIRYRIRKPRALRDLIKLVETLPAPVQIPEGVA